MSTPTRRVVVVSAMALILLVLGSVPVGAATAVHAAAAARDTVTLHLFWADGCPHCETEWAWIGDLRDRHPEVEVIGHEVTSSVEARDLWMAMSRDRGVEPRGVPTTILGEQIWVGFDQEHTAVAIEAAVLTALDARADPADTADRGDGARLDLPLVGEVDLEHRSLLVSSLLIGFVDGFNPCSLWVLSVLLALVLHSGSRRRILLVGGTFLLVTTALYGIYIVGLLSVLAALSYAVWVRVLMAGVAGIFGLVNIKDYVALHRGPSLSIPDRTKPAIYRRMRRITAQDTPLPAVLGGTAVLAVGVSVIETPCTAGLPLIWSNLLAAHEVGAMQAAGLFGAYMSMFLLDELAVLAVAVVTMRAMRLQERHGRALKLGSGLVMVALAGALLLAPGLLLDLRGTLMIFGGAAAVTAAVLLVERLYVGSSQRDPARRSHR
jgi:hypothetical protein